MSKMKTEGEQARPALVSIRGVPLIKYFAEMMDQVEGFEAHPDDLLISTYPKSGTTWISEVIDLIYKEGDAQKCKKDPIYMRVPFLEFAAPGVPPGIELLKVLPPATPDQNPPPCPVAPQILLGKELQGEEMIYVARNAKDVLVSYYYFYQMAKVHPDPGTWDEFLEKYMAGDVSFGSWYDHVKGWWDKRKESRMLYLFYEDMKEDPQREIRKVMEFLGRSPDPRLVEKIAHLTSFKEMRQNSMANYTSIPANIMDHSVSPFMRKGELARQLKTLNYRGLEEPIHSGSKRALRRRLQEADGRNHPPLPDRDLTALAPLGKEAIFQPSLFLATFDKTPASFLKNKMA
ncbi:hypothetical protein lerEdw1_007018, partial [Lerista edwardsae]